MNDRTPLRHHRSPRWRRVVFGAAGALGLTAGPAFGASSLTVEAPPEVVMTSAGARATLTIRSEVDTADQVTIKVRARREDGRPCEADSRAFDSAVPYEQRVIIAQAYRSGPVTTVPVLLFSATEPLRLCTYLEVGSAPLTMLVRQDQPLVVRAARGDLSPPALGTTTPMVGSPLAVGLRGSAEDRALLEAWLSRGPCGEPDPAQGPNDLGAVRQQPIDPGPFDHRLELGIPVSDDRDPLPDRVCTRLTATGARAGQQLVLAAREQAITPAYDGTMVQRVRLVRLRGSRPARYAIRVEGRVTGGSVSRQTPRIVGRGGRCAAIAKTRRRGSLILDVCLLAPRPQFPLTVEVGYVTGLGIHRGLTRVRLSPQAAGRR